MPGRSWELDPDGYLLNDCSWGSVDDEWRPLIDAATTTCVGELGTELAACYLTGSVPRGTATAGLSDLDLISVTRRGRGEAEDAWADDAEIRLRDAFPIASGVGIEIWPMEWLDADTADTWIFPFIIKVHSLRTAGEDLAATIRRYRVEPEIARDDLMQIDADLAEAIHELRAASDEHAESYWVRRISKNVLRAGFGLVMLDVGRYTRDIDICYQRFIGRYPEHAADMAIMRDAALGERMVRTDVLATLDRIRAWIVPLANRWLEAHA
jgi:hypothetical protein